jgi:hypothetical protein
MKLDRITLHTTASPRTTAVLARRGPFLQVEDGSTMAAATVNRVVAFLTSPRPREVLGELGEAQVDGVTWATRTPADDPDDLACALSELARFGVVPDWSELVDDGDLVAAP